MRTCQVCKITDFSHPNVSFHRFPQDPAKKRKWMIALKIPEDKYMPKFAVVCEFHFSKEHVIIKANNAKLLKSGAIPMLTLPLTVSHPETASCAIPEPVPYSMPKPPPEPEAPLVNIFAGPSTQKSSSNDDIPSLASGSSFTRSDSIVDNSSKASETTEESELGDTDTKYLDVATEHKQTCQHDTCPNVCHLNLAMSEQWHHSMNCKGLLSASQENPRQLSDLTFCCNKCAYVEERVFTQNVQAQTSSLIPGVAPLSPKQKEKLKTSMDIETSSITQTASETEELIIQLISDPAKKSSVPPDLVGPSSDFRGRLGLINRPLKRKRKYIGDLSSDDFATPRKAKKNFKKMRMTVMNQKKQIKTLQNTVNRLRLKTNTLNDLLKLLRQKSLLTETSENALRASLSGPAKALFERMLKGPSKQKYEPVIRSFALTLSFYSPRAYSFVRKHFNRTLPHLSTISKWFKTVDGSPGFTQEALTALKLKSEDAAANGKQILCNLVFDEMSIRRQVEWTGSKFTGHVDIGTKIEGDVLPEAKEALVFLLVPLNGSWKIPVGYFLLDGLPGSEKAELLKKCLEFIHETGVTVTSVTFDGAPANFTMCKTLGANFSNPREIKSHFQHPITKENVYIFLDPCHMLKLLRNCLGSVKNIAHGSNVISWHYLQKLVDLQDTEGLQAATRIKKRHLDWAREKMRVKLAAQTFSKSVADALSYLGEDLRLADFRGVAATAEFIQKVNDLFDIFNSRNRLAKYIYKRPLSPATEERFFQFFVEMEDYICNLKVGDVPALQCPRKTGFLGFLICMQSLRSMYEVYVREKKILKYILTYKLSQDHIELFFGSIRSKGGYNNNPTARQFEAAYKRLLVHSEISGPNSGNVVNLENIPILSCGSRGITVSEEGMDIQESQEYINFQEKLQKDMLQYSFNSPSWNLTDFSGDIVSYISGFVVKSLKNCVKCFKCLKLLEGDTCSQLQKRKEYGRLVRASKMVLYICRTGEKYFRFFNKTNSIFTTKTKNVMLHLITGSANLLSSWIYDEFGDHLYENEAVDGHSSTLIKLILKTYFNVRIHHETTKIHSKDSRVRSVLHKTILFKGQ